MAAHDTSTYDLGLPDVGFGVLTLVSLASTVVVQLLWMILLDSTGLDRVVPMDVFMALLPGLTVAVVPTLAASYLYSRWTTLAVGVGTAVAGLAIAAYTVRLWALCGPGC